MEVLSDMTEAGAWLDAFLTMEHLGWKGEAGTSIRSNADEMRFFEEFIPAAAEAHALRITRLMLDDKAIAFTIDLMAGQEVFALKVAYDPAFARFSPGVLLELENLKYYLEDSGIARVDSCATPDHSVLSHLWGQEKEIVQLVIGRRGLRYQWPLALARLMETGAARLRSVTADRRPGS